MAVTEDHIDDRQWPPISVIVIGRNEGHRLVRCLRSVRAADYPAERIELIYVDTNSTDSSCAEAERIGARVVRINPDRPCAAAARNAGLRAAKHGLIQFLDGDAVLDASWLKVAAGAMADPELIAVHGDLAELDPRGSIYNFWMHHDWHMPAGKVDTCGGIVLFRRSVLLEAGGYDESLIAGEERDLCCRILRDRDATILHLAAPMALHDGNIMRFGQYWRRCFRSGHAYAEVGLRHRRLRRWRRMCQRNILHGCALMGAIGLAVAWRTAWPVAVWCGLLGAAIVRDAGRSSARQGTVWGALTYAAHHYLAKLPMTLGHLDFYVRHLGLACPRNLIEYRSPSPEPVREE
ncbi:MAG: glycosyltransferase [Phycisphaerae bacterium]|nr:glycosyltransferase [Phycisphaerae bacterium]